ncbi:MAG: phage tail tape measure protein [Dehalococcoidia bacterium]|jgi:TP901 family phage tail tape measure protein|nr:phage tail tape measure protein [Dehalococcoidia bacterium]
MNVFEVLGSFRIDKNQGLTDLKEVNTQGETAAKNIEQSWGKAAASVAGAFAIGKLVGEFKSFIKDAIQQATEYETKVAELATMIDPREAGGVGEAMRKLSEQVPITSQDLMTVANAAARMGIDTSAEIDKFVTSVARIGVATGELPAEVAEDFGQIKQILADSDLDFEGFASAVGALAETHLVSWDDLIENTKKVADNFVGMGVSAPNIAALVASFTEISGTAKEAASQLQSVVSAMKDKDKIDQFATALGLTNDEFVTMRDNNFVGLLGDIAQKIADGGDNGDILRQALGESASKVEILGQNWGRVEEAVALANGEYVTARDLQDDFNTKSDTLSTRLETLGNRFTNLKQDVGEALLPALEDLITTFGENEAAIGSFFTVLTKGIAETFVWIAEHKEFVVGAIAAVLAGFLAFQAYNWIATFNPITAAFQLAAGAAALLGGAIASAIARAREFAAVKRIVHEWAEEIKAVQKANEDAAASMVEASRTSIGRNAGLIGSVATMEEGGITLNTSMTSPTGITSGIAADITYVSGLQDMQAAADEKRAVEEAERLARRQAAWNGFTSFLKNSLSITQKTVDEKTGAITEEFTKLGDELKSALTNVFQGITQAFIDQGNAEQEYQDRLGDINADEKTRIEELAALRDQDVANLEQQLNDKIITQEQYNAEHQRILDDYVSAEEAAKTQTQAALEAEKTAYEETKKSTWELLKETVKNVLKALKEELFLKAAASLAEAIALTFALSPLALPKFAESGAYAAGGAALAITGFAHGGIATRELMARLGDTGVHEAVIPLTQANLSGIGKGIIAALQGPQLAMAGAGGTTYATDMRGLFDGATINVDSPQRVESLAREINTLWETRKRGRGY